MSQGGEARNHEEVEAVKRAMYREMFRTLKLTGVADPFFNRVRRGL